MAVTWAPLHTGIGSSCFAILLDGGDLYAGGSFAIPHPCIAKFSAGTWSALASGPSDIVYSLAKDATGNLYAGGKFNSPGNRIAKWNGAAWSALGTGLGSTFSVCRAVVVDNSGTVFAGGSFSSPGAAIAKWDGAAWSALGSGLTEGASTGYCYALAVAPDGSIYTGGRFTEAGGTSALNIAKWDGVSWTPLGSGLSNQCYALAVSASGVVYAGGSFTNAGGVSVTYIAKWDGVSWTALEGLTLNGVVTAISVDADENVYIGGAFSKAGDITVNKTVKWTGSEARPLSTGVTGSASTINAMAINSATEMLYAGGTFTTAGGVSANNIAEWDMSINTLLVRYTAGANGTISGRPLQIINPGADATAVSASPSPGYYFWKWSDGLEVHAARHDLAVSADIDVYAWFSEERVQVLPVSLSFSKAGSGPVPAKTASIYATYGKYITDEVPAVTGTDKFTSSRASSNRIVQAYKDSYTHPRLYMHPDGTVDADPANGILIARDISQGVHKYKWITEFEDMGLFVGGKNIWEYGTGQGQQVKAVSYYKGVETDVPLSSSVSLTLLGAWHDPSGVMYVLTCGIESVFPAINRLRIARFIPGSANWSTVYIHELNLNDIVHAARVVQDSTGKAHAVVCLETSDGLGAALYETLYITGEYTSFSVPEVVNSISGGLSFYLDMKGLISVNTDGSVVHILSLDGTKSAGDTTRFTYITGSAGSWNVHTPDIDASVPDRADIFPRAMSFLDGQCLVAWSSYANLDKLIVTDISDPGSGYLWGAAVAIQRPDSADVTSIVDAEISLNSTGMKIAAGNTARVGFFNVDLAGGSIDLINYIDEAGWGGEGLRMRSFTSDNTGNLFIADFINSTNVFVNKYSGVLGYWRSGIFGDSLISLPGKECFLKSKR